MSVAISHYEDLRDYSIEVRIRNARILGLMRRAGIPSIAELSRRTGIHQTALGKLVNLKLVPIGRNGRYLESVERIAAALSCHPDDMFTDHQRYNFMASNRHCIEVAEAEVEMHLAALNTTMPDEQIELLERDDAIRKAIANLTPRQRVVIESRFGFNGAEQTLDQVGEKLNVSPERVRQMEKKALEKLRTAKAGLHVVAGVTSEEKKFDTDAFIKHQAHLSALQAKREQVESEQSRRILKWTEFIGERNMSLETDEWLRNFTTRLAGEQRNLTRQEQALLTKALWESVTLRCDSCGKFTREPPLHLCPECHAA